MTKNRSYSIAFKRQVAEEYLAGAAPSVLGKRHDLCRNLVRIWVRKYEAGEYDDDARAARGEGVPERLDQGLLADQAGEVLRPVFPGEHAIGFRNPTAPRAPRPARRLRGIEAQTRFLALVHVSAALSEIGGGWQTTRN